MTVTQTCVLFVTSLYSLHLLLHVDALPRLSCSCLLTALANIQRRWLVSAPGVCPWGMLNLGWSQLGMPKWWMTTLHPSVPYPWRAVYPQPSPQMDFMAANSVSVRLCRPAIHQVESAGKFQRLQACHLVWADMWVISAASRWVCCVSEAQCPDLSVNKLMSKSLLFHKNDLMHKNTVIDVALQRAGRSGWWVQLTACAINIKAEHTTEISKLLLQQISNLLYFPWMLGTVKPVYMSHSLLCVCSVV